VGTIEKQVAITLVSILVMGAIGVAYILIEPYWREVRGAQMREHSAELGKALYGTSGCVTCHLENGYGTLQGGVGWPLNTTQNQRGTATEMENRRQLLYRTIDRGRGAVMPAHGRENGGPLNAEQMENLVDYIQYGHWPVPPVQGEAATLVQGGAAPGGSPGAQLFAAKGCAACHQIGGQGGTIGPNLTNIGTQAATRKPGMSAEDYIRESITNPGAFTVEGFQPGLMPTIPLTPDELNTLVQYLMEQK
jgi:mono/diheme cytochrome c family protein